MKYELLGYKKCSTCKNVEKIIKDKGLDYTFRDITEDKLRNCIKNQDFP